MSPSPSSRFPASRSKILRDLLVFQVKLWLEGFKDVVLVPLSLAAGAADVLFRRAPDRGLLYTVMRAGVRFEQWVDLYGTLAEIVPEEPDLPVSTWDAPTASNSGEGDEPVHAIPRARVQ